MKTFIYWIALYIGASTFAQISGTGFELPEIFSVPYTDTGDAATAHDLQNNSNEPIVDFSATGSEIGFNARYVPYDTPGVGLTDGDAVGVTESPPSGGHPFPNGLHGYVISDVDGNFILEFDPVFISSPLVSIDYFISDTGYEGNGTVNASGSDRLRIYLINLNDNSEYDLLNTTGSNINDLDIAGAWTTASVTFDNSPNLNLQLVIEARNNSEAEAFYFDSIVFDGLLGIKDAQEFQFEIYPNPAENWLYISSNRAGAIYIQIYDVLGKEIIKQHISENFMDISRLYTGLYILKMKQGDSSAVKKLVIKK